MKFPAILANELKDGNTEHLSIQVNTRVGKPLGIGGINIGLGEKNGVSTIVWDLAIASIGDDAPSLDSIEQWLREAHDVLSTWFITLVQGDLLQSFRGEC